MIIFHKRNYSSNYHGNSKHHQNKPKDTLDRGRFGRFGRVNIGYGRSLFVGIFIFVPQAISSCSKLQGITALESTLVFPHTLNRELGAIVIPTSQRGPMCMRA